MAYTETDLTEITKAIASGTLMVRIGDRMVTYQSLDSLRKVRDEIANALGMEVPASARGRAIHFVAGHGL